MHKETVLIAKSERNGTLQVSGVLNAAWDFVFHRVFVCGTLNRSRCRHRCLGAARKAHRCQTGDAVDGAARILLIKMRARQQYSIHRWTSGPRGQMLERTLVSMIPPATGSLCSERRDHSLVWPSTTGGTCTSEVLFAVTYSPSEKRTKKGKLLYQVRWNGCKSHDGTWEPLVNFTDCDELVFAFIRARLTERSTDPEKRVLLELSVAAGDSCCTVRSP
ncbi:Chromo domain [Trinorchestia longiramus]|nr:Chromo domain [Trinorchestia longiramus]